MSGFNVHFEGIYELSLALKALDNVSFDGVAKKNLTEMLNRARAEGGTPVKTGELRKSTKITKYEMGYSKNYAPYVEFGHRLKGGGYVKGKHYLKNNVDKQNPILKKDLESGIIKALKGK